MSADRNDALRRECEVLAAEYRAPLPAGDEGLIAAVRRWHELEPRNRFSVSVELDDAIVAPIATAAAVELQERIEEWAPQGLRGASAKVRYCIDAGLECEDVAEQLLAVIERDAAEAAARGPLGIILASDRDPFALARSDAELVDAEQEFRRMEAEVERLRVAEADEETVVYPVIHRWAAVMDRIALTPPASIAGCVVKLRTLLHPDVGMAAGDHDHDLPSLRQILVALERATTPAASADSDGAIVALFHEWQAAHRAAEKIVDEAEHAAACERIWVIEHQIFETPVAGSVGLAVKAYFVTLHGGGDDIGPFSRSPFNIGVHCNADCFGNDGRLGLGYAAVRGLMRSASAFLPELAPLVAEVTELPLRRPGSARS